MRVYTGVEKFAKKHGAIILNFEDYCRLIFAEITPSFMKKRERMR